MLKLLWVPVVALLVGLAFLLGLSFGLGESNASFVNEVVPVLSMIGGWVSGIGALAAVLTTLWLADKQRRENAEKLELRCEIKPAVGGTSLWGGKDLVVEFICSGTRPVRVSGARIGARKSSKGWIAYMSGPTGKGFPFTLNYGESEEIRLSYRDITDVLSYFDANHNGDLSIAQAVVFSTLGHWELDVSSVLSQLKHYREKQAS